MEKPIDKTSLEAHAFNCIVNRDKWQNELNATVQAIENYKEPEPTPGEDVDFDPAK